ncbi:MAG: ATP-binding cassette domain-containing protein [Acidimicrobiales bacterium]
MNCLAGVYRPDESHPHRRQRGPLRAAGRRHRRRDRHGAPGVPPRPDVHGGGERRARRSATARPASPHQRDGAELAERFGFHAEPDRPVWQLSMGERQRVEILKALWRDARVLILDEPTAVLTPQEAEELGRILRRMVDEGRAVIFISHKLDEVTSFCDEATVLRAGATVASAVAVADVDAAELAGLMVGDVAPAPAAARLTAPGEVVLAVRNLSVVDDRGLRAVDDVSLDVRAGEIVGIAGVAGNGQRGLTDAIAGLHALAGGSVEVMGRDVSHLSPRRRFEIGLAYVPEDRLGVGLAPKLPITENSVMRSYRGLRRGPLLSWSRARDFCTQLVERFEVKVGRVDLPMASLSGGNLQRLLLGRELSAAPHVIVASQPTRGLDVGGVRAIQQLLVEQRDGGSGILMVSEDLDELLTLSDRILVMVEGKVVATFDARRAGRTEIGAAMMGQEAGVS